MQLLLASSGSTKRTPGARGTFFSTSPLPPSHLDDHLVGGHHHVKLARLADRVLLDLLHTASGGKEGGSSARKGELSCSLGRRPPGFNSFNLLARAAQLLPCPAPSRTPPAAARTRSSALPWNLTALMTGHQRRNSFSQLCSVDLGTMTMCGPVMPRNSRR